MERKKLIGIAHHLGLEFPKNVKTTKLQGMVDERISELNAAVFKPGTTVQDLADDAEQHVPTFAGYHPFTREPIYK